jgi:alpha-beta hydrolase superfamily lysophospholipase
LNADTFQVTFTRQPFQPLFYYKDGKPAQLPFNLRSFVFESSSKNQINGWMVKPNSGQPVITLVYFHGSTGNLLTNFNLIEPLAEKGYQVFMIDYSGFGLSGGKPTRLNALADALSAIDFVKKLPMTKSTKFVLWPVVWRQFVGSSCYHETGCN